MGVRFLSPAPTDKTEIEVVIHPKHPTREPPAFLGIDHLVLRCARFEKTLAFYSDLLGCPVEREVKALGLYQLRAGRSLIDLVPIGSPLGGRESPQKAHQNLAHFCLTVDAADWDAMIQHLATKGVDYSAPERRYGATGFGPSVYIEDPEGNVLELKSADSAEGDQPGELKTCASKRE